MESLPKKEERRAPVQQDDRYHLHPAHPDRPANSKPGGSISWDEHMEIWRAYNTKYPGQSAERLAQRGGFGHSEIRDFLGHDAKTFIPYGDKK